VEDLRGGVEEEGVDAGGLVGPVEGEGDEFDGGVGNFGKDLRNGGRELVVANFEDIGAVVFGDGCT
jgi:hypothetical protein